MVLNCKYYTDSKCYFFYCVSSTLQYILEDDDIENLDMYFLVGVLQMVNNLSHLLAFCYPTPSQSSDVIYLFSLVTDQQINWDETDVDLDPDNPEKPLTSQNK